MKKIIMLLVIATVASSAIFGQMKSKNGNNSIETQLIKTEKQAWEEWKNKNRAFVQNYLSDDAFLSMATALSIKRKSFRQSEAAN